LPHTANSTNSSASLNETIDQVGGILSESNGTKIVAAWRSSRSIFIKLAGNATISDA
jgi:hypothetical protein